MIGLFNDCFPPIMDGVSLTVQNYAYWLQKKTGNVCVVTPKSPGITNKEDYPIFRYSSIPIPMRKPYRLGFPRIDFPFHNRIHRLSFSLVHAHCPFSSGNLAMRIAKNKKIPIIATFHSKYKADFERVIKNKSLVNWLLKNVIDFYESADEVWIPQAAVEETLREYGYKGKVEIVDNGNDFSDVQDIDKKRLTMRHSLGIKENELMFLFVGQHILEKNLIFLIQSLNLIKEYPFQMFFIGSGYAQKELQSKVVDLGLSHKITFLGTITDREQLSHYYAAADLFLFPSLYDNAPLVVREAAALNTPSLLIQDATSAEIINDSVNGFLAKNSPKEFAYKITDIIQNPQIMYQVGQQASHTIARSWEDVVDEVVDRYQNIIHRYYTKTILQTFDLNRA